MFLYMNKSNFAYMTVFKYVIKKSFKENELNKIAWKQTLLMEIVII